MQGSFEKKVQEKLDELRLQPTAPVWDKIESRIQPEKKRRRGVFWLFFLLALLIAAGWWLIVPSKPTTSNVVVQAKPDTEKNTENNKEQTFAAKESPRENVTQSLHRAWIGNKEGKNFSKTIFQTGDEPRHQEPQMTRGSISASAPLASKKELSINQTAEENRPMKANGGKPEELQSSISAQTTTADSVAQNKTDEPTQKASPLVDDSAKRKIAAIQHKWTNKILFTAGWASTFYPGSAEKYYGAPSSVTNGSNGNLIDRGSSDLTKGFAFTVGYAKEKEITSRLKFSVGLQYTYLSTHQNVGRFRTLDTAVRFQNDAYNISGYYSYSSAQANLSPTYYTNRYHVIELPVGLQWRLWKNAPLWLSTSVSYGRLVGTNALTFDAASGVYYANKKNNKRNLVNAGMGLQYALLKKEGWKLFAGPSVQYNLLSLQKISANQHLLFAGLKTSVEF